MKNWHPFLVTCVLGLHSVLSCAQTIPPAEPASSPTNALRSDLPTVNFEILSGEIDNSRIYYQFLNAGKRLVAEGASLTPTEISDLLKQSTSSSSIKNVGSAAPAKIDYPAIVKSSLLFGTIYDCGRCDNLHASIAGGVIVSEDGLALTNYHVLDRNQEDTKTIFAMTFDGQSHPVTEILSANKRADVALVRLGGKSPFFPAPIATQRPLPLEPVTVLSHPKNQFFVLTQGVISRHVNLRSRRGLAQWTEITADYGAGSSGSGVFNSKGEIVGLVSRNYPLRRSVSERPSAAGDEETNETTDDVFVELVLRRCVSLSAIRKCFAD